MTRRAVDLWLMRSWWVLFPCFTALIIRLAIDRACAEPYNLAPALAGDPAWAWPLAIVYVLAHLWIAAAYLLAVSRTQALMPTRRALAAFGSADTMKLILMSGAFVIEYSPMPLWRLIGTGLRCTR